MTQAIITLSAIFLLILILYYFSNSVRIKRKIKRQQQLFIHHFPDGGVGRVSGKAFFNGSYINSPVTTEEGLYSRVTIFQYVRHNSEVQIFEKKHPEFFIISDATGYALVYVKHAKETYSGETEYNSTFSYIPPVNPAKFLADHYIISEEFFGVRNALRINEFLLKESMEISVFGKGYWVSTQQLGINLPVNRVLVFGMKSEDELYITNKLKS
ncbi:MAG: hypothetical protein MUC87_16580 [Bacteroidia bacterium]|jgi:hypothetical protein|nr:hypothetical protein [Bacteroidia bacterium]